MYSQDTWVYFILDLFHISKKFIPFLFKGIYFIVKFCYVLFVRKFIFNYPSNPTVLSFFCDKFAFVKIIFCTNCYKMYQCLGTYRGIIVLKSSC